MEILDSKIVELNNRHYLVYVKEIECNDSYVKTYKANHRRTKVITKDMRNVNGKEILETAKLSSIDLLAGCPPCQGFSSLTFKHKKEDPRNSLILEMSRIVREIKPNMVMMENVPGLKKKGKLYLDIFINDLEKEGYVINCEVLIISYVSLFVVF